MVHFNLWRFKNLWLLEIDSYNTFTWFRILKIENTVHCASHHLPTLPRTPLLSPGRQWPPTPALLPGKSNAWRSLVGCSHGVAKSRTRLSDFTFTLSCQPPIPDLSLPTSYTLSVSILDLAFGHLVRIFFPMFSLSKSALRSVSFLYTVMYSPLIFLPFKSALYCDEKLSQLFKYSVDTGGPV